jgi:hypothetical protein
LAENEKQRRFHRGKLQSKVSPFGFQESQSNLFINFILLILTQIQKISQYFETVVAIGCHYKRLSAKISLRRDVILPSGIIFNFII